MPLGRLHPDVNVADAPDSAILTGKTDWLTDEDWAELAAHPHSCIETEYHHFARSVDADGLDAPSDRHPVFYGCFDWHSAVHSHWALCRQLRLCDSHPDEAAIRDSIDGRLTPEAVEREREHVAENPAFERPYGWGWFLRLAAELHLWNDPQAEDWRERLEPLEAEIRTLVAEDLLAVESPHRVGTHPNTAFALACALDYARVTGREDLAAGVAETARSCYIDDTDYPLEYEPLGYDFLSPALTEATLVARVLEAAAFVDWFEAFLPSVTSGGELPDPVAVGEDESDLALHFVGLNFSRAWSLAALAEVIGDHPCRLALEASARDHATAGLDRAFTGDYAGAHWLSSFVLYLLSRNEGGIGGSRGLD